MAEHHPRKAGAHNLEAARPDRIRNVVLVGPTSSGKTTLVEALLFSTGAITRAGSVAEGTTVSDFEEDERLHQRSVSLAVAPVVHGEVKINLIDTPGYADFVGELRAGLRAADCALFVVAANEGVDETTRQLWRECDQVQLPRAVVITKLDHPRADFAGVLAAAQAAYGDKVLPLFLPGADHLEPVLDAVAGHEEQQRARLIEAIIEESEDETLMDRYVDGEAIAHDVLLADLETAVARGTFFPVVPVCSATGVGTTELLDLVVDGFPSPAEHVPPEVFTTAGRSDGAVTCSLDAPLLAEVVKTTSDPYVGRVSVVRVFSGMMTPDVPVHVSGHFSSFFGDDLGHEDHDEDERIGALAHPFGAAHVPTGRAIAGDIVTLGRLTRAETGDTLSSVDRPRVLEPWSMPEPLLPIAIEAATKSDEDKLSAALARLTAEDPSLRIEQNPATGQLVLWVLGEAHADVALDRLESRFGVVVERREVVVALRETLAGAGSGRGRHVKQSGGHGQFAICEIDVEPLGEGAGLEFVDRVVGGAVPRQFIASVEKGLRAQMERGVRHGYPLVDLRVTLTDGKAHSVDSSDMAFQSAAALALREAAEDAGVTMLEPYDEVGVLVLDDQVGAVMSDLSARRGRLLGTDKVGEDRTTVRAVVPQTALIRYAVDLRATTHGVGSFTRSFAHYEPMAENHAAQVTSRG